MNFFSNFFLLQIDTANLGVHKTSGLIDIILTTGTSGKVIFVILLLFSILAGYIIVERWITIGKAGKIDEDFMNRIRGHVQQNNLQGARALCQSTKTPVARVVEKGLMRIGKPLRDINSAVENVGNLEMFKLEKGLSILAFIAAIAPMIGLLGTVVGMIISFQSMSSATTITPQVLSEGIYHALTATAFGLCVSIVAMTGYNLLVAKVDAVIFSIDSTIIEFIDLLQEPTV